MRQNVATAICCLAILSAVASAAVPSRINIQGRLTDAADNPLPPGDKTLTFKVYDDPVAGTEIWPALAGETQIVQTDDAGLWNAEIGAVIPLADNVFSDTARWLEITVDDGVNPPVTMPRIRLATAPYAHRVSTIDGSTGGVIRGEVTIGYSNLNTGAGAFVTGVGNDATGDYSVISGGQDNSATGHYSTVSGGQDNSATGQHSTIGGGNNSIADGLFSTVGGGNFNSAEGPLSTVGGGDSHEARIRYATIAGGLNNLVDDTEGGMLGGGTISGGFNNRALGYATTVGGGDDNIAGNSGATVSGGSRNYAYGAYSVIGGGGGQSLADSNFARGDYSVIPGGRQNVVAGDYSFAAGRRAKALHSGTFVWADDTDSDFASTADKQFLIRAGGGVGINTNSPDQLLHVFRGDAGMTANANSIAVFEHSGTGYLSVLTPSGNSRGVLFGQPEHTAHGAIIYNSTTPQGFQFRVNGNITRMVLDSLGYLGVGTTAPSNRLTLPNVASASGRGLANAWNTYSSRRWKQNIRPIEQALETVRRLDGVRFEWTKDGVSDIGLIAEDVGRVVPEVVQYEEDGVNAQSLDYSRLVPLLIEGIKEQQEQIRNLRDRVRILEEEI